MIESLRRNPVLLALALLAGVLAMVLALEMRLASPSARDAAPKGARAAEAKLLPPIAARPPEQAYPEVTARPLFVSTRRPAPEAAVAQAPTMPKGKFTLQGVIVQGDQRIALLRERTSGRVHRAEAGKEVDGLKVLQIDREAVTLGLGDERETVNLIVQKAGGAPAMAAAAGGLPAPPGTGPFAAANPFPRPGVPGTPGGAPGAPAAVAQGAPGTITQVPPPQPGTPLPTAPGFGPPLATPGSTATAPNMATPPTAPGAPQAGPAFPMSPEELLARRRARRAQQNQ